MHSHREYNQPRQREVLDEEQPQAANGSHTTEIVIVAIVIPRARGVAM